MYSIVDIETTGGDKNSSRITEIAIYLYDGEKIVDEFVSLINPERQIPDFITRLTGINNEMVASAPRFFEVAKRIVEITQNSIFVAHNAGFDYNFIRAEFEALGYNFELPSICTVKMSRAILPGHQSYSLGKLCNDLGIAINGRHRAGGDAYATVKLFEILLSKNNGILDHENPYRKVIFDDQSVKFDSRIIKDLPTKPGVYYFKNGAGDVIYIGKSNNIRAKVVQHLTSEQTKKKQKMLDDIVSVDFELTGNELIAALKEIEESNVLSPQYNKTAKQKMLPVGLFSYVDRNNYIRLLLKKNDALTHPIASFDTFEDAQKTLYQWMDEYSLCQKLCGLYEGSNGCFQYQIKQCHGACVGEESASLYNIRAQKLIDKLDLGYTNLVILDKGRRHEEFSVVYIENGVYLGYGYFDASESITSPQQFRDFIQPKENNHLSRTIIKQYLNKHKPLKLIQF